MDFEYCKSQLRRNGARISELVAAVSSQEARWKRDPETWSILEVVNHLYDEEREDFRVRLEIILHRPEKDWPPIDPQGWVTSRKYNERELKDSLENFLAERQASLAWLDSLSAPDWSAECRAPWGGRIAAGDMMAAWVGHDLLHMRQLVEIHRAYMVHTLQPYSVEYAGPW